MGRRKTKSPFASLGMALSTKHTKSKATHGSMSRLNMTSPKKKGRKKKGGGMDDLSDAFMKRFKPKRQRRRMGSNWFTRLIQNKMTPTERAQLNREVEEAIENDQQLKQKVNDEKIIQNQTFINRMVSILKERLFAIWKG